MKRSRMFHLDRPRPVKIWNPVHGCRYGCYRGNCWAARMAKRLQAMGLESYERGFEPAFVEKELSKKFGPDDVVFVASMGDPFGNWVPSEWIRKVIEVAKLSPATFFFETKNPARYAEFLDIFPKNAILSTTIETNRDYGLSKAPPVGSRYEAFRNLSWPRKHISVEPIMDFDLEVLAGWLLDIGPEIVSVGFDNYHNHLPEPSPEKVMSLIQRLEKFTKVERKVLRCGMGELSVYCPKERKRVPVWHCLGSFVREKETCSELISAEVGENKAVVRCRLATKESTVKPKTAGGC